MYSIPESNEFLTVTITTFTTLLGYSGTGGIHRRLLTSSPFIAKPLPEKALTVYTRGGHSSTPHSGNESYREAYRSYEKFVTDYPKSQLVADARFGMASCLEELNQLEEASRAYAELKGIYPSPQVIDVKLRRIKERLAQKSGAR